MISPLRSVLHALAERPEVAGVAVISDEGLLVDAVVDESLDRDALAALAATALRALAALGEAAALGTPDEVVIDGPNGTMAMHRLSGRGALLVLASDSGDLGAMLYELRRHTPTLSALV